MVSVVIARRSTFGQQNMWSGDSTGVSQEGQFVLANGNGATAAQAVAGKVQPRRGKSAVVAALFMHRAAVGVDAKEPTRIGIDAGEALAAAAVLPLQSNVVWLLFTAWVCGLVKGQYSVVPHTI